MTATHSAIAIEVSKVTKLFGAKTALDKTSFYVNQGSIFGFLGPNGAGKTTTIRCIMDYLRPTSGQIKILGKDAHRDSTGLKRQIGFLSSDLQLNMHWTGEDHLTLFESVKGKSTEARRIAKMLGLDTRVKAKTLSTGNKQKLAVALAFTGDPQLLVMDEPTSGLDPVLQRVLYDLLKDFAAAGKTVFFSSHNLTEVQNVCNDVALIKDGRITAEKSMQDIRDMNVHIISITATNPFRAEEFSSPNIEVVSVNGHDAVIKVAGDLNPAVQVLAKHHLTDLGVEHANLEDIFINMYKE